MPGAEASETDRAQIMKGLRCMKQENIQTAILNALKYHVDYQDENEPESSEVGCDGREVVGEDHSGSYYTYLGKPSE